MMKYPENFFENLKFVNRNVFESNVSFWDNFCLFERYDLFEFFE